MEKQIKLYSDGACSGNPGKGGIGGILFYKDHKKEFSQGYKLTTNNRMELLAVINGLKLLKEKCKVDIYTDSNYLVKAINEKWLEKWQKNNWKRNKKDPVKNVDLWKQLIDQLNFHKVKFHWVKGHNDNLYNERADFLATSAINGHNLMADEGYIPD